MLKRLNRALLAVILQIIVLVLAIRFGVPWAMGEAMQAMQASLKAVSQPTPAVSTAPAKR